MRGREGDNEGRGEAREMKREGYLLVAGVCLFDDWEEQVVL